MSDSKWFPGTEGTHYAGEPLETAAIDAKMTALGYTVEETGGNCRAWEKRLGDSFFAWISTELDLHGDPNAAEWQVTLWAVDDKTGEPRAMPDEMLTLQGAIDWVALHDMSSDGAHEREGHASREIPADTTCPICIEMLEEIADAELTEEAVAVREVNLTGGCSECSAPWEVHDLDRAGVCKTCAVDTNATDQFGHCTNDRCPETRVEASYDFDDERGGRSR